MVPHGGGEGASPPAAAADGGKRDPPQRAPRATHKASSVHERARFVRQNMHHNGLSDKRARDWTVSDGVLDEGEEEAMFQGHAAWVDETRPGGEVRAQIRASASAHTRKCQVRTHTHTHAHTHAHAHTRTHKQRDTPPTLTS